MRKKEGSTKSKNVLFTCGVEVQYPRNAQILHSLKKYFKVREITSHHSSYILRLPELWARLFFELLLRREYDLIFVGYLPQPLMPLIKFFRKDQLVLDPLISIYDTLCFDRKMFKPNSLIGKMVFWLDRKSFQLADRVATDTPVHGNYFAKLFNLERKKFQTLYNGVDEKVFYPRKIKKTGDKFVVFFSGTYLPLHGMDIVIKAAKLLEKEKKIVFRIVGRGPLKDEIQGLAKELELKNIEFIDWIPYHKLPGEIAKADVCLGGHFSNNEKAKRVISGKTFLFLAMKKPTIVGQSPATQAFFRHGQDVYMCKMASGKALAGAISRLFNSRAMSQKIAQGGYKTSKNKFSLKQIQKNLLNIIEA